MPTKIFCDKVAKQIRRVHQIFFISIFNIKECSNERLQPPAQQNDIHENEAKFSSVLQRVKGGFNAACFNKRKPKSFAIKDSSSP